MCAFSAVVTAILVIGRYPAERPTTRAQVPTGAEFLDNGVNVCQERNYRLRFRRRRSFFVTRTRDGRRRSRCCRVTGLVDRSAGLSLPGV